MFGNDSIKVGLEELCFFNKKRGTNASLYKEKSLLKKNYKKKETRYISKLKFEMAMK